MGINIYFTIYQLTWIEGLACPALIFDRKKVSRLLVALSRAIV